MEKDKDTRYQPPVERLLTYGESEPITPDDWPDYRTLGIGPEHIPELIQMATDEHLNEADAESTAVWDPLHAWRALGQLRAVEPLSHCSSSSIGSNTMIGCMMNCPSFLP
jgi:hypothetical protein